MRKTSLLELIGHGENSEVVFRDTITNDVFSKLADNARREQKSTYPQEAVREAIVKEMQKHNGTSPDLIEDGELFMVRLWNKKPK